MSKDFDDPRRAQLIAKLHDGLALLPTYQVALLVETVGVLNDANSRAERDYEMVRRQEAARRVAK